MIDPTQTVQLIISGGAFFWPPEAYVYPFLEQAPELSEFLSTVFWLFATCIIGQFCRHLWNRRWMRDLRIEHFIS